MKHLIFMLPLVVVMVMVLAEDDPRCENFQRLTGGDKVISTYSWSAVPDIDEYKLNFYGASGQFVTSYWIPAGTTALDVNLGDLATGAFFQWEVEALENGGAKVCNTGRSGMTRLPNDRLPPVSSSGTSDTAPAAAQPPIQLTAGVIPSAMPVTSAPPEFISPTPLPPTVTPTNTPTITPSMTPFPFVGTPTPM